MRVLSRAVVSSLVVLAACPPPAVEPDSGVDPDAGLLLHVPSPRWEDQIIYFVFTDRFANGDPSNDDQDAGEYGPADKDRYSGGDLQGIIDRLDYIQGLGATAIWITPPVANMWWDPEQRSGGYHGYWARHLKRVDEHLGTLETYRRLSDALHRRGMYLIQDVVPNHMGNFFTYFSCDAGSCATRYPQACRADWKAAACDVTQGFVLNAAARPTGRPEQAPFDQVDARDPAQRAAAVYHWTPQIEDYGDAYQSHHWALSDLDDLNSENPQVRTALKDSYGFWVREVGVDGFRVDTARYVPVDFWTDFFHSTDEAAPGILAQARATGRAGFHFFGEIADTSLPLQDGAEQKLKPYFGTAERPAFPALLAYPLFGEINGVFAQGNPTANMTYRLGRLMDPQLNPAPYLTPTFVDNHDQSRFLSVSSGNALVQAVVFIFTVPGIPTLYYGTEQGFTQTRQAMFDGGFGAVDGDAFRPNYGLYQIVRRLSELRKASPALRRGRVEVLYDNPTGPGGFVFRRQEGDEQVLVFINTADTTTLVTNMPTGLAPGTVLEKQLSVPPGFEFDPPIVDADGGMTFSAVPRGALVARVTSAVQPPPPPDAGLSVFTPLEGQVLTEDTVIRGAVWPPTARVRMVTNGNLDTARNVSLAGDGGWSITLPVSTFPVGRRPLTLSFYQPESNVGSPRYKLETDVVFMGRTITVEDPPGDDRGPTGTYRYPTDSTFTRQLDLTRVTALVGATTLRLELTTSQLTNVWGSDLGFDHVVFNVFFEVPGQTGLTALPLLQASAPSGFTWSYGQFAGGWKADNRFFNAQGASATAIGTLLPGPTITTAGKTITLEYDRTRFTSPAISSWNGVRVYVTTWDYDGVQKVFRPLSPAGGTWDFGGAPSTGAYVMDDVAPITLAYP